MIVETDAGGDPDDEQSMVRLLLYSNDLEIEGIIVNRREARDGENKNPERTGPAIVRRQVRAYREVYPRLVQHDRRYPTPEQLDRLTVSGLSESREGIRLIREAVAKRDPRPVWICNWGTDFGSDPSSLRRTLDEVLAQDGEAAYRRFKDRILLSSDDQFGEHTRRPPPFRLWVDTFRPPMNGLRWYHRFSAITAKAGGFDVKRDVLEGHGPLGALYPLNTTHPQKEGDTMTFLYLVPTGMNDPMHPEWGSWGGRYGLNPAQGGKPYYFANQQDTWNGTTSRDNVVARWAADLQNDFRTRLDWCVQPPDRANHPPAPRVAGSLIRTVRPGQKLTFDASASGDPDGDRLNYEWRWYPEATNWTASLPSLVGADGPRGTAEIPRDAPAGDIHLLLTVRDAGTPPLARYRRIILKVVPDRRRD